MNFLIYDFKSVETLPVVEARVNKNISFSIRSLSAFILTYL